ncbi:UNVERIFIED_CONTAM: Xyloglucan galactosyltransferase XLT2 [Sesamum angustifolium]|uniref:Xyloglucan galactosyltransferase XLT2 n=1 Tax=Sesamum angustifolium TaxID=2727405 RepID=A0AAW2LFC6_9LAMI
MLNWVSDQPFFKKSYGWDHFITVGRISWDFRRSKDGDWGSSCIYLPKMRNITRLLIEKNPWDFDFGRCTIPQRFPPQLGCRRHTLARFRPQPGASHPLLLCRSNSRFHKERFQGNSHQPMLLRARLVPGRGLRRFKVREWQLINPRNFPSLGLLLTAEGG